MIGRIRPRRDIMPVTAKQLLEAANATVPKISGKEAQELVAKGALLVDVRDGTEVAATGKAVGAVHVPRGLLEFKADPSAPTADRNFSTDKTVILHCASGGRAALAGKLLKDMGYEKVFNLGGLKDWVEAGGKVEKA
jgi:rhodanese-related sulfurtransferase